MDLSSGKFSKYNENKGESKVIMQGRAVLQAVVLENVFGPHDQKPTGAYLLDILIWQLRLFLSKIFFFFKL